MNVLLDLTPRESAVLLAIRQSTEPLTIPAIQRTTGYRFPQTVKTACAYLASTGVLVEIAKHGGEPVYACA